MSNNTQIILFIVSLFIIYYLLHLNENKITTNYREKDLSSINSTNIGFVKPEHRLLKIFNNISSGSKITLNGICNRYIYNKNTIDTSINDRLITIIKDLINSINKISNNDYYIKLDENVDYTDKGLKFCFIM